MSGGNDAEDTICFVAKKWIPKATTAREIEVAGAANQELGTVKECTKSASVTGGESVQTLHTKH